MRRDTRRLFTFQQGPVVSNSVDGTTGRRRAWPRVGKLVWPEPQLPEAALFGSSSDLK